MVQPLASLSMLVPCLLSLTAGIVEPVGPGPRGAWIPRHYNGWHWVPGHWA
jgi:hypothetical protein